MLQKLINIIKEYIKINPEYIEFQNKLIKLKKDLKDELKELIIELDERNTYRRNIFINELFYGIVIGFLIFFVFNCASILYYDFINANINRAPYEKFADIIFEKQEWMKQFVFNHDNEIEMRIFATKIYQYLENKELDPKNDKLVSYYLNLWRKKRKKWEPDFKKILFSFEQKKQQKQQKQQKQNFITFLRQYFKKK